MGTFSVQFEVGDLAGRHYVQVEAIVDTGSTYTALPQSLLRRLGLVPWDTRVLELADNRIVEFPFGGVRIRLEGREALLMAVFGPDDATPLLGATTLEMFGLGVDPVRQRLVPVTGLMKRSDCRV